jgi:hypothetical protein
MIVKAWDLAAPAMLMITSGQQWIAMRELYRLADGHSESESQALALFMWWVERFTVEHDEGTPSELLMMPQMRMAELPPERSDPLHWPNRDAIKRMWKARVEERRSHRKAACEPPLLTEGLIDEPPPPESGWDAGLDADDSTSTAE